MANSIKNMLGIDAHRRAAAHVRGIRTQITNRTIDTAFRAGWNGDYPSMIEFLDPAVRHRRRLQRRRILQPGVRRCAGRAEAAPSLPDGRTC